MPKMTEQDLEAALVKRGWTLVAFPDQKKKPGARFRATRDLGGTEQVSVEGPDKLLERVELYEAELLSRGLLEAGVPIPKKPKRKRKPAKRKSAAKRKKSAKPVKA